MFELANGYVPAVTEVDGVIDLERVLSHWVNVSDQLTVGAVASYGGTPVIGVRVGSDRFDLNLDTTRTAVRAFLASAARAGGAGRLPWHVTVNQKGVLNRVSYLPDDTPTPGWYAYLKPAADAPRPLG